MNIMLEQRKQQSYNFIEKIFHLDYIGTHLSKFTITSSCNRSDMSKEVSTTKLSDSLSGDL